MSAPFAYDARWLGPHGIGRFAREILRRFSDADGVEALDVPGKPTDPHDPWRVARALERTRPRGYWTPGFNPPARTSVPFAITVHDLIHLDEPGEASGAKRAYYRWLVRPALHRAAAVLTVSEYARARIASWSGLDEERITVVGNGVDATFTPQGPAFDAGGPYLLFLGTDKPHKNLGRLITAFEEADLPTDLQLLVAGKVSPRTAPRQVRFLGPPDDDVLPALYRGALATIVPSTIEGFGLVALESMACGTPVVAGALAAAPEVLGHDALLVDPHSVPSIRGGLERIVGDAQLHARLQVAGPARAAEHTWDSVAYRVRAALDAL